MDTALICSREEAAVFNTVTAEDADRVINSIARAEEIMDVRDKAVESAANSRKRMGVTCKLLVAVEVSSIPLKKECGNVSVEMENV